LIIISSTNEPIPKRDKTCKEAYLSQKQLNMLEITLDVKSMGASRNFLSFAISVPAGILLLIKGISGPTETYAWLLNYLSSGVITDELIQSIITTTLLILIFISSLGGLAVLAGGFLVWKSHITIGKLLISLGAGVGFLWVIFLIFALVSTGDLLSQYSVIGWTGLILAFIARLLAK
jgi:hypothetical protein